MTTQAFEKLSGFIRHQMKMSHIYQPMMLRVLLQNDGRAAISKIAKAFVTEDQSQIEYYEQIVKRMPGRVLKAHGIVERDGFDFKLTDTLSGITAEERAKLISQCQLRLDEYLEKRGLAPWQHRRKNKGVIPGSLRFAIIARAKGRCEACGISVEERALEIDHIVPRNKGGSDDPTNLQALCYLCNAQKRDTDDTNFSAIQKSYEEHDVSCPFCQREPARELLTHELGVVIRDLYPVTSGHVLVIPKRHVSDYFELHKPERNAIESLLFEAKALLSRQDPKIQGFNVGINVGEVAGQTVNHVHVHLIPRRKYDMEDPRGGVRGVIPEKQKYEAQEADHI